MAQLVWVVALVGVIIAIQLAVYLYLGTRRGASPFDAYSMDGPSGASPSDGGQPDRPHTDAAGFRCAACGAVNDPSFTFCRRCVSRLGA